MSNYEIRTGIDLHDVQGNIVKGFGRSGFPLARYFLYQVRDEKAGRRFVALLLPALTTGSPWTRFGNQGAGTAKPPVTLNVALSFEGLRRLGVPEKSLLSFPEEFASGMRSRAALLGDDGPSNPSQWDPVWDLDGTIQRVHVLVSVQAKNADELAERTTWIDEQLVAANTPLPPSGTGVVLLGGHSGRADPEQALFQDAAALKAKGFATDKEHFGFADGISDPFFSESGNVKDYVQGGGKRVAKHSATTPAGWVPLATGEFLLGHIDEADEYPAAPIPTMLSKNGTFLVYRKLHQNTASFDRFVEAEGATYGDTNLFAAKLVGRWKNGAPLVNFPTEASATAFRDQLLDANRRRFDNSLGKAVQDAAEREYYALKFQQMAFDYDEDLAGERCPMNAHIRRTNPRSTLEFGTKGAFRSPDALVNRRRILRRGMPYGASSKPEDRADDQDHGLIFVGLCASIARQFEFAQQQWVNYGNDFHLANNKDPIAGNHPPAGSTPGGHLVIDNDPANGRKPYFCNTITRFVETRGGDYFFVPSPTALLAIARGDVDPT